MNAQPDDVRGAHAAALTSLLLIAQQVAGKAARDALFLSSFHTSSLPVVMAAGALLSVAGVYWLSRVMVVKTPAVVMPVLFGLAAAGFFGDWLVAERFPKLGALLVYLQTALLSPVMISTFWSLINERFDPRTAKRAASRIAAGGTLGGVLGGLAAWRASSVIEPLQLLLVLSLLNAVALVGILVTRSGHEAAAPVAGELSDAAAMASPLTTLRDAPFLRSLALLVALGAAISALLDYVFSVQATAVFKDGQSLLSFFSLFWLVVGVVSLLLQMTLGRLALEKLGLAVNITILPGLIVMGGAFGLAVPGLASASLLRGAEAVQRNTLFRAAYELLYTPIPESSKRATKAVIDVGCDRLGTVVGSGLVFLMVHLLPESAPSWLLGAVVALALLTLPVTRRLHLGYVKALEEGLRAGAAKLLRATESAERLDRQTRSTSPGHAKREELIERIEELQPGGLSALVSEPRSDAEGPVAEPAAAAESPEDVLATARALLAEDPQEVKRALGRLEPRDAGVACAIRLLGNPEHRKAAAEALRRLAPELTGQLLDSLLDPSVDFVVRRRIPRVLAACSTQRAADGLLLGIADERFEVRYECGLALLKLTDTNPDIVIAEARVIDAIRREVESGQELAEQSAARAESAEEDARVEPQSLVEGLVRDRAERSLEHMFTILSLILEREPLRMAFAGLHHEDQKYRGTALEYLDTVLPRDVRDILWPYLGESAPLASVRPASELLAELLAATESPQRPPAPA